LPGGCSSIEADPFTSSFLIHSKVWPRENIRSQPPLLIIKVIQNRPPGKGLRQGDQSLLTTEFVVIRGGRMVVSRELGELFRFEARQ
jgi:hypothetical protein